MNGEASCGKDWRKISEKEIAAVEALLRKKENDYVSACGRFFARVPSRDTIWTLDAKKCPFSGILINAKAAFFPVLCGRKEIPNPRFLKSLLRRKKIHSVQGLKEEVNVFEDALEKMGGCIRDIFDYDLMTLDKMPVQKDTLAASNLVLRVPQLTDLDAIAPLQSAYEKEEVLSKSSVYSPAASRINLTNIIAKGKILAAELDGKIVGKINVNAVSFTRYQVGGVYVRPDFRGQGIARRMAYEFAAGLIKEGRRVTLFVKKSNIAARRLYLGLGFGIKGDYRITYY